MNWILIDIGNTNIKFGIAEEDKVIFFKKSSWEDFKKAITKIVRKYKVGSCIVCSVVPVLAKKVEKLLNKEKIKYYECGKNIFIPVVNNYKEPQGVGQDRLINVYAANKLYKDVRLVIDLGTAVTFDFISRRGEYSGGLIFPGVKISLDNLLATCALLPEKINFPPKKKRIKGKTTQESISSGVIFGYSFLIKGIIDFVKKKEKEPFSILLTGGGKELLVEKITGKAYKAAPFLSLKGLNLLKDTV